MLLVTACGAGENRIDPSDLELRDLLGLAPEVAAAWDPAQRAAARAVIEAGIREAPPAAQRTGLGDEATPDRRIASALAAIDRDRARRRAGALGVVDVAIDARGLVATPHAATLAPVAASTPAASAPGAPGATPAIDLQLRGWDSEPELAALPARGTDVLAELARNAGHRGDAIVVAPAPQLAVAAGYLPATATEPARLVVNPVILAALEPAETAPAAPVPSGQAAVAARREPWAASAGTASATWPAVRSLAALAVGASAARAAAPTAPAAAAPAPPAAAASPTGADGAGNPYSFYGSVGECAAAQRDRCTACLPGGSCTAVTRGANGNAECSQLGDAGGRGYYLLCINLALSIDAVDACAATGAPSCPRDTQASGSLGSLEANASFLDDAACATPLDACLAELYGPPAGGFPGPGSDAGSSPRPRHTAVDCSDSCSGDANCDDTPDCELDGPSCDAPGDSCDDGGTGGTGGDTSGCSGDSEDSCGSSDNSSCDSSDCSSSDGGGCDSGGGGGDCSSGGGGDCSGGGGGDCGGGGGDCSVAGRRGRTAGASLPIAIAWALLPIGLAAAVRRRAARRRRGATEPAPGTAEPASDTAAAADDASAAGADREVAP